MKLVKSLLLGSAAGLVAVAGASAADLGVKKPTAVEYVKTCPQYGAGFFVVPGTTSCLKIIGRVRVDTLFNDIRSRSNASAANTFRARGYFGYDHRTATEYGLLRTYVRGFVGRDNAGGAATTPNGYGTVLEYAFIQFGGLTVGRITPVLEHGWANLYNGSGAFGGFSDLPYVNSLGYTYQFGGGFSATLAVDSANERKVRMIDAAAPAADPYGAQAMPDIVGKLDYTASWGQVFVGGAVHQLRAANGAIDTEYGFAVTGGIKVNLPMISQGSNFWVNGNYSDGAVSYVGFGSFAIGQSGTISAVDAVIVGGSIKKTKAWSVSGALEVFAAPTVRLGIYGTYADHNANNAIAADLQTYSVWGQAAWLPVSGFQIGGEVGYIKLNPRGALKTVLAGSDKDSWVGRIRFQRDF